MMGLFLIFSCAIEKRRQELEKKERDQASILFEHKELSIEIDRG